MFVLTNKSYIGTNLVVFINFWYYQELSSFVYRCDYCDICTLPMCNLLLYIIL